MDIPKNPTGKCFVCGRSTKLFIHQKCGRDPTKSQLKKHKRNKRQYLAGYVPWFAKQ